MRNLEGKVALVTGGARGIGRGIALALARAGADVAVADVERLPTRSQQYASEAVGGFTASQATAREIAGFGRKSTAIQADVTSKQDVVRMVRETVQGLGGLDVLVCNAGVVSVAPVEEMPEETWDLTLDVNVKGVFLSCQAALPELKKRPGASIINIASVAGKNGFGGMAHYCASKFAVVGFTNSRSEE